MISSLKTLAFRQAKVADQQPPRYMGEKPRLLTTGMGAKKT
jgi:hypothetical protein